MANQVAIRAGGLDQVSQYTLTIGNGTGPGEVTIQSFVHDSGHHIISSASGEVIIKVIWNDVDGGGCVPSVPPIAWPWDTTLSANGSHQILVKAYDAAGNVGTSIPVMVTVNNTGDTVPPVISTVRAATTPNSATITWATSEPANGQVEYGLAPCLPCTDSSALSSSLTTSHSITLSSLATSTLYNYRVFSRDAAGNLAISASFSFRTTATPNAAPSVALGKPNGGESWAVGSAQSITWNAVDDVGVSSVSLFYSTDGGANWNLIASGLLNTGSYSWPVPNAPSASARVMVIAFDGTGASGADVSDSTFTIAASCPVPAAPTLQSIAVQSGSYTVLWGAVVGATYYVLEESTTAAFSSFTPFNHIGTSRFISGNPPGTYYYRVKAVNDCGQSAYSGTQSATVTLDQGPGEITAVSPPDYATGQPLSVNLCWSASHPGGEALQYNVYVATSDIFDIFNPVNLKLAGQTATCFSVNNLPYNARVWWGIEAIDTTGNRRVSPVFHFTTFADANAPTGTISVNNDATTTDTYGVILFLTASDAESGVGAMRFSNDGASWSDWIGFAPQHAWNVADWNYGGRSGLATYAVYAQFRDFQENVSPVYSDTIMKVSGRPGNIILNGKFYETIQDAINAAAPGDTVFLTEGVFTVNGAPSNLRPHDSSRNVGVVLRPGVSLKGAGTGKTTIDFQNSFFGLVDADNATIEGFKLVNSSTANSPTVVLLENNGSRIRNCLITGNSRYFGVQAGYGSHGASNAEIAYNVIVNNIGGIIVFSPSANISILNNTVAFNSGDFGVFIGSTSSSLMNNIVASRVCDGFVITGVSHATA